MTPGTVTVLKIKSRALSLLPVWPWLTLTGLIDAVWLAYKVFQNNSRGMFSPAVWWNRKVLYPAAVFSSITFRLDTLMTLGININLQKHQF